jgi:hypothetical protein
MNTLRHICALFLALLSFFNNHQCLTTTEAYRIMDVVDATMYTRSFPVELLMASMPLFGVPRTVKIPRVLERFSLSFEEGLHSLPYIDGQSLETLQVTFIYSRSGEGRIHSVTSNAIRSPKGRPIDQKVPINVEFIWVEEEAVNFNAGISVMFLATLVSSILFLIQLCAANGGSEDHSDARYRGRSSPYPSSTSRMGKSS